MLAANGRRIAGTAGILMAMMSHLFAAEPRVKLETDLGTIVVEVDTEKAPITAANFLRYVDEGRFAGATFYRTVRSDNDNNPATITVIQGGIGDNSKQALTPIAHETTQTTGLKHTDGTISMARNKPGSAASEFFITIGDNPALDFGGARNPDGQGFAAFGHVVEGMDVVRKINAAKADKPNDEPYTKGQILNAPVGIKRVTRAEK